MKKQKALFLLTLMLSAICMRIGATSMPVFAAEAKAQEPTLYGCMIYSSLWNSNSDGEFGIYSFPATSSPTFTPVSTACSVATKY